MFQVTFHLTTVNVHVLKGNSFSAITPTRFRACLRHLQGVLERILTH